MKNILFMLVCALLLATTAHAQKGKLIVCAVSKVYDGDYVGCDTGKGIQPYRVIAIDAPEIRHAQPYAVEAREELRKLILGKNILLELIGRETRWNRRLVRVWLIDKDVGLELVRVGAAWYFPQYARGMPAADKALYVGAFEQAQALHLGLWERGSPIKPGQWRKGKRN